MKYILNENIALRSWHMVSYAYYIRHMRNAAGLTEAEYEFLSACDGATEAPAGSEELAEKFLASGMIREAKDGEAVSQWSRPRYCDNRVFPCAQSDAYGQMQLQLPSLLQCGGQCSSYERVFL